MFDTKLWFQLSAILFVSHFIKLATSVSIHTSTIFLDTAMNILIPTFACVYVSFVKNHTNLYQDIYYEAPYVIWAETAISWASICSLAMIFGNLSPGFAITTFLICLSLAMSFRRKK